MHKAFPSNFIWGAATSAHQVEGAAAEDGRAPSIWNVYEREPGRIFRNQDADGAVDQYHRFPEDVALMRAMGLPSYRFSVSWSRVMPDGTGAVNEKGLAYYERLTDALLAAGVTPCLTLFHWDLPEALQQRGHWLNRDSARWFADYAAVVAGRLGDRVKRWITVNEPTIHLLYGYREGCMAPGMKVSFPETLRQLHHLQLAHGLAVRAIRSAAGQPVEVGWTHACAPGVPATDFSEDREAARAATFDMPAAPDDTEALHASAWWNDPVYMGRYPEKTLKDWAAWLPPMEAGDREIIAEPVDFCGLNIYHSHLIRATASGPERTAWPWSRPVTTMGWPVTPEAYYWGPRFFYERYGKPIWIFENGMAATDGVSLDGRVHDPVRIDYLRRYLRELRRAIGDGVDVRGNYVWSLLDVFEWNGGFKDRFGLVHVDLDTQRRIPKDSAEWYKGVIESNGGCL